MDIFLGYLFTYLYVFLLLGISALLKKVFHVNSEATRKVVHIGCGFSWFIMAYFFKTSWHLLIPPITFVILNYISYKKNTFSGMEREDKSSMGTVFYPISMTIMSAYTVFIDSSFLPYYGIALLCLSLSDGFAPIFGRIKTGNRKLINNKSFWGSLSVLLVTMAVICVMSLLTVSFSWWQILLAGIFACILELIGKNGYDNIYLPLGISFLLYIFKLF